MKPIFTHDPDKIRFYKKFLVFLLISALLLALGIWTENK